jgi:hypothetical protein
MKKLLVEKIFDPKSGWPYESSLVPVEKKMFDDTPNFHVVVDELTLVVWQITKWEDGSESEHSPDRIVIRMDFSGIEISDPAAFLHSNYDASALPSWAIDEKDGQPALQAAFPVSADYPLDLARRQTIVCMGIVAEQAAEALAAWEQNADKKDSWETAGKVAKVTGMFLGALLGINK